MQPLNAFRTEAMLDAIHCGFRPDLRDLLELRKMQIDLKLSSPGYAMIESGATRVSCTICGEIVKPPSYRTSEGSFQVKVHSGPSLVSGSLQMSDALIQRNNELGVIVESVLIQSHAVFLEMLCLLASRKAWAICANVNILNDDGSVLDAIMVATIAALITYDPAKASPGLKNHPDYALNPVKLYHWPILCTYHIMDEASKVILVDATKEEELVSKASISIAMNEAGDICAIKKYEGIEISIETIQDLIQTCEAHVRARCAMVKKALDDAQVQRF